MIPQYQGEIAKRFYGLHVLFIIYCAIQMVSILRDVYELDLTKQEVLYLASALKILQDRDIIRPKNKDSDDADTR